MRPERSVFPVVLVCVCVGAGFSERYSPVGLPLSSTSSRFTRNQSFDVFYEAISIERRVSSQHVRLDEELQKLKSHGVNGFYSPGECGGWEGSGVCTK